MKKVFALLALSISVSALAGCSASTVPAAPVSAPVTSFPAATPAATTKPSPAAELGITEEQLSKIVDKKSDVAEVAKLTEATCKTYADGGGLADVIRDQAGVVLTTTKNLTPEQKLFFGALASVAGDKIEQNCPEFTDEFTADAKALLSN